MTAADASKGQFRHVGRYVAGYAGEHRQSGISSRNLHMIAAIKEIAINAALAVVAFALGFGIMVAAVLIDMGF